LGPLSLEQDVHRRDYTINALMWALPRGPMIDLVGGVDDLASGRIRAVHRDNLERDPVRLLRGPRFLSTLGGLRIENRTAGWIRELGHSMASAPRERIGLELLLLSRGSRASEALAWTIENGLFEPASPRGVQPDLAWLRAHVGAADRLATASRHPLPGALHQAGDAARIGLLVRAWNVPSLGTTSTYAWPREVRKAATRAAALLDHAVITREKTPSERRELIHEAGDGFPALAALAAAVQPEPRSEWRLWWRQWRRGGRRLTKPTPLLSVEEVASLAGVEAGPELGRILGELEIAHVRGDIRTPSGARRWLKKGISMSGRNSV
jgi:tRNA nucleotidyltransferase (CCA-adding enzyme)